MLDLLHTQDDSAKPNKADLQIFRLKNVAGSFHASRIEYVKVDREQTEIPFLSSLNFGS